MKNNIDTRHGPVSVGDVVVLKFWGAQEVVSISEGPIGEDLVCTGSGASFRPHLASCITAVYPDWTAYNTRET